MGIGSNISKFAIQKGYSIRQLALAAGVPYTTLYSIVKRDSNRIDNETISKISAALGISVNLLLGEYENMQNMAITQSKRILNSDDPRTDKAAKIAVYYFENSLKEKGYTFSLEEETVIFFLSKLNSSGQKKAIERIEELTEIPKYQLKPEAGEQDAVDTQEDN